MFTALISTEELAQHLDDESWVIVDCRFDLAKPEWGFEEYQKAHIPGSVYASLDKNLSGPKTSETGRHPLPAEEDFFQTAARLGIDANKQVVVYDTSGGSYADRLWWMLKLYGHPAAAVLDGGFGKWLSEGRPTSSGIETNPLGHFTGKLNLEMMASIEDVEAAMNDPRWKLVDARSPERYRGENEPIDPVAGHIPGAINRFHGKNLRSNGTMKPPEQLKQEFRELLGETDPDHVILYCGSGVTSIHHALAMESAGMKPGKVFVGSWSQWVRNPKRPIAKGGE